MGMGTLGGAFLADADYDFTGDITVSGSLTVTGTMTDTGSTLTSPTITSPTITGTTSIGSGATLTAPTINAATLTGVVADTNTVTATTIATTRYVQSSLTLTPTSTISVTAGGSLAAMRGDITLTAAKSFTDGFLYGVQGKFTMNGTMAEVSAARATGVLGQVDLSTGTLTAGQISAVWGDLQGNPTLTVNDQLYVGRFTNSMSAGKKAQAFQLMYGAADLFFEASADGGSADWAVIGAGTYSTADGYLLVNIYGTNYRIALFTGTD